MWDTDPMGGDDDDEDGEGGQGYVPVWPGAAGGGGGGGRGVFSVVLVSRQTAVLCDRNLC